jgi:hypothetical protein
MIWSKKTKQRPPEDLTVPDVMFIGEQDGESERGFKEAITPLLNQRPHVLCAFLARVDYGTSDEFNVALCIRTEKPDDVEMREDIGKVFSTRFGTHEHLDTILIRVEQEAELRSVCRPFYEK